MNNQNELVPINPNVDTSIYYQMLREAGIPTTQTEFLNLFQSVSDEHDHPFNNNSRYSSFWRLIQDICVKDAQQLVTLLATSILPNQHLKDASGAALDNIAESYNVERKPAVKALGKIQFLRTISDGDLVIHAGTKVGSRRLNNTTYILVTTESGTILNGSFSIEIPVIASAPGVDFNLAPGFYTQLITHLDNISVSNLDNWLTQPGTDNESDQELRVRAKAQYQTQFNWHTNATYQAIIAKHIGIDADQIRFSTTKPRGEGSANAYVLFDLINAGSEFLTSVNHYIRDEGHHGLGDDLLVLALPETQHTITVTVYYDHLMTSDAINQLKNNVIEFIGVAFRKSKHDLYKPTLTMPEARFSFSTLGNELTKQFHDIHSIRFTNPDIKNGLNICRAQIINVIMEKD